MAIDKEKLEQQGILWTETCERSKLKEITNLLETNRKISVARELNDLIKEKRYIEFQTRIGIEGKKADGKLGQSTLERLEQFLAVENTGRQVFRNLTYSKKVD